MTDAVKVVVYVRAAHAREIRARGDDPAQWVRDVVWMALRGQLVLRPREETLGAGEDADLGEVTSSSPAPSV